MARATVTLSTAVDEYLAYMKARRLEPNTVKNATYLLRGALALWGNVHVCNMEPRHVDRLFASKEWGPRTTNTNLQIVRQFFAWCRNMGYLPLNQDPCFGWKNVTVPSLEKLRVPVERFPELLDAAEHPRDRAVIACGLFLFLRGSEMSQLRISSLDFQRSTVNIYRQKTKEEDTLPMCSELTVELNTYLNFYRKQQGTLRPEWFLLPAKRKQPWVNVAGVLVPPSGDALLNPTAVQTHTYRPAQRVLDSLGFATRGEGEHTLRRSGARAMADQLRSQGYDGALLRVASMLGHKDTKQSEHYIGWHLERQQRNEALAGKPMFGDLFSQDRRVLRIVEGQA